MTREEAIEVYNGLINTKIKEAFEFFAPELRESEDERHRKWILEYLYDGMRKADEQFKGQFNAAIAYLEKQKEQTADNQFPPLEGLDAIKAKYYDKGFKCGFDEGIDSAKTAEWSEEDEKIRRNLMSLLANMRGNRITEETYQKYYPWLKDLRPSWKPSEEQMQYLLAVINDPNNAGAESCHLILESLYNDLKKLM